MLRRLQRRMAKEKDGFTDIDSNRLIIREYENKNSKSEQPSVGGAFLKWVLTHQATDHCEQVSITQIAENDFAEFPRSQICCRCSHSFC